MSIDSEEFRPTTKNERELLTAKAILEITNGRSIVTDKCRNGKKHDNNSVFGDITGEKIIISSNNIAVIDIDFNKKIDEIFGENEADEIREDVKSKIDSLNVCLNILISRTTSGGFHIYCDGSEIRNNPEFDNKSSVHIHAFNYEIDCVDMNDKPCKEVIFDIDLFVPTKNDKKCGVMLPGSLAINKRNNYGYYEIISLPNERAKKLSSIYDVFEELDMLFDLGNIDSIWKEKESISPIIHKKSDNKITPELINLIKFGFDGLTIHNYGEKIEKEISLFTIACALNACSECGISEEIIDDFISYLYNHCILTSNAELNFDKVMYGTSNISDTPFVLVKMLRIHNPEYYEKSIKPILYNKAGIIHSNSVDTEREINEFSITKDLLNKIVGGFNNIELTLDEMKSIIHELKSCEDHLISKSVSNKYAIDIADNCKLNEEIDILSLLIELKNTYGYPRCDKIIEILKERNNQYYEKEIAGLIKPIECKIDLRDNFSLNDIEKNNYVDIENQDRYFVKIYDGILDKYVLDVVNDSGIKSRFNKITIFNGELDGKKQRITLTDIVFKEKDNYKFRKRGVKFNSNENDIFSLFQGYGYDEFDDFDIDKISLFLNHIKEVIASNNEDIYKYIISWIAYLIQNPGQKTKTCLVLIGKHGVGKTIFTDIISKLFGEYANDNLSDVDLITGQFNTEMENKILIVLNEFNVQDKTINKRSIRNKMKDYITDAHLIINKKNVNPYKIENVSNFIIVTNDTNPICIENGDRRYVVVDVSDKMKGNIDYFMQENKNSFYPKGKYTSKRDIFNLYLALCEQEKIKFIYDGPRFYQLLDEWCEVKSQWDNESKYSKKVYILKDEFINN